MESGEWISRVVERVRERAGGRPVLLGVSGGLDSMTLWSIVQSAKVPHGVAHVDYGLRGDDSLADRELVQSTARRYGVRAHVKVLEPTAMPTTNVQATARAIRMDYFGQLLAAYAYAATLLAHHADDQLETILMGLVRGGGPRALAGMRTDRSIVHRPLLDVPRQALAEYAEEAGVAYRADASNASDRYLRNRLRHRVIPKLLEVRGGVHAAAGASAEHLHAVLTFAEGQFASVIRASRDRRRPHALDRDKLRVLPGLRFFLHEWLGRYGATRPQLLAVRDLLAAQQPGKFDPRRREQALGSGFALVSTRHSAWVERRSARPPFAVCYDVAGAASRAQIVHGRPPGQLRFRLLNGDSTPGADGDGSDDPMSVLVWLTPTASVLWRTAERADRLSAGAGRHTRVRSVLAQACRPPVSRGWDSVLTVDGAVVWVVGCRSARPAPATGSGARLWEVTVGEEAVDAVVQPLPIGELAED